MATLPYRTAPGTGGLPPGLFGRPGAFQGMTPGQVGFQNRPVVGRGIGGHPFYSLVAYHQSRAYRDRSRRPPGAPGPFQPRPPYNGGQPPRRNPLPAPPPVFPVGPLPIGPELPVNNGAPVNQQPIYYNPGPVHPAVLAAQMGLLG